MCEPHTSPFLFMAYVSNTGGGGGKLSPVRVREVAGSRVLKHCSAEHPGLLDPSEALFHGARDDHGKHSAMEIPHSAEIEDAPPPDCFQGIAECGPLPLDRRIRRVDDDNGSGIEQAYRNSFTAVAFLKAISHPWTKNAVDPAFQDGWRLTPPVGMDNHYNIG